MTRARRTPLGSIRQLTGTASAVPGLLALALVLVGAAIAPAAASETGLESVAATVDEAGPAFHRVLDREGIELEVTIDPLFAPGGDLVEGDVVNVRFAVRDTHTGQPMPSLYPAGWMDRLSSGEEMSADDCGAKVASFIGGGFLSKAELDLNTFYVLALNEDASISVVDPLFSFGGSKLLASIALPAPGGDWELTRDQQRLFVTIPDRDQVAIAETASWDVVTFAETGPRPMRIVAQPDSAYLWVGYEGDDETPGGVTVISTTSLKPYAAVTTGRGPHDIAFSDDSRFAYVTNRGAGTVSVVDVGRREVVATVETGPAPAAVAYSGLGGAAFVTDPEAGTVAVIDGDSHRVVARLEAEKGLGDVAFAPGGRWGFVPVPTGDSVHIVDAAGRRIVQTAGVDPGPTEVAFSDELAYVTHSGSDSVLMIPLPTVGREGEPVHVVDFPAGAKPAGDNPYPTPAARMVQAPGAPAMLIANPRDRSILFYKEGMAAPMGHFRNYGRMPRAVMVVDRSLREVEPGIYETAVKLRRPGAYNLAVFLDSPRVVDCLPLEVKPDPAMAASRMARRAAIQPLPLDSNRVTVGDEVAVGYKLLDPLSGEPRTGVEDVIILALGTTGNWQSRLPAEETEPGVYTASFAPPAHGVYYMFVAARSLGISPNHPRYLVLQASAPPPSDEPGAADGAGERMAARDEAGPAAGGDGRRR